ncbi:plasmid mobilization protein [Staphylococcus xylosus]
MLVMQFILCYNINKATTLFYVVKVVGFVNEQSKTSVSSNAHVGENQNPNRRENKQISFRVSETEYEKLRQSAETLNMSVPSFVKKKAQGSRLVAPKFDKQTRQSIAMDLSKLGNNVNQIAKTLNSGALASKELSHSDMQNLMKHIQSFRQEVNTLWQRLK